MRYVDASALAKVVVDEDESRALRQHLRPAADRLWVTSIIARTEVAIAISKSDADPTSAVADSSPWFHVQDVPVLLLDVTDEIAILAASLGADLGLRTLDAIHVATAAALRPGLAEVVTYDRRMAAACAHLGITAVAPGAPAERQS